MRIGWRPPSVSPWGMKHLILPALLLAVALYPLGASQKSSAPGLSLERKGHLLTIRGPGIPAEGIVVNYLEAYCRSGSADADWVKHTVIPHKSKDTKVTPGEIRIRDVLVDGLEVVHVITAGVDELTFEITAHNPTAKKSEAQWAQPCVRLGPFCGFPATWTGPGPEDYLPKCFLFIDSKPVRMPTPVWAKEARYTPGQVWCPEDVPRTDVNPRPLNPQVPSCGLIGCYSGDNKYLWAVAFEPYQELFQGVARCLHSDFRLGGVEPGATKKVRGKMYVIPADMEALLARYRKDFPDQVK